MQVCTSLQTDNHASTPPLSFLQAGFPSCRPTNSVKALKAIMKACKDKISRHSALSTNVTLCFVLPTQPQVQCPNHYTTRPRIVLLAYFVCTVCYIVRCCHVWQSMKNPFNAMAAYQVRITLLLISNRFLMIADRILCTEWRYGLLVQM